MDRCDFLKFAAFYVLQVLIYSYLFSKRIYEFCYFVLFMEVCVYVCTKLVLIKKLRSLFCKCVLTFILCAVCIIFVPNFAYLAYVFVGYCLARYITISSMYSACGSVGSFYNWAIISKKDKVIRICLSLLLNFILICIIGFNYSSIGVEIDHYLRLQSDVAIVSFDNRNMCTHDDINTELNYSMFEKQSKVCHAFAGEDFKLSCKITKQIQDEYKSTTVWMFKNVELNNTDKHVIKTDSRTNETVLIVYNVSKTDFGNYTCITDIKECKSRSKSLYTYPDSTTVKPDPSGVFKNSKFRRRFELSTYNPLPLVIEMTAGSIWMLIQFHTVHHVRELVLFSKRDNTKYKTLYGLQNKPEPEVNFSSVIKILPQSYGQYTYRAIISSEPLEYIQHPVSVTILPPYRNFLYDFGNNFLGSNMTIKFKQVIENMKEDALKGKPLDTDKLTLLILYETVLYSLYYGLFILKLIILNKIRSVVTNAFQFVDRIILNFSDFKLPARDIDRNNRRTDVSILFNEDCNEETSFVEGRLKQYLTNRTLTVFTSYEVEYGRQIADSLSEHLQQSRKIVIVWSNDNDNNNYITNIARNVLFGIYHTGQLKPDDVFVIRYNNSMLPWEDRAMITKIYNWSLPMSDDYKLRQLYEDIRSSIEQDMTALNRIKSKIERWEPAFI